MKNRLLIGIVIAVLVIAVAGYFLMKAPAPLEKSGEDSGQGSVSGEGAIVAIKSYKFNPATANIAVGEKVTWRNSDGVTHDITFDNGMFKNDILPGQTITIEFNQTGTYEYACKRHPTMEGRIVVS